MKYREEVVAKIFTYITVFILIGIIAFEAYMVQMERNKLAELETQYAQAQSDLKIVRELNYELLTENEDLQAFKSQWMPYAAFSEASKADKYKNDLFSRISLIPQAALDDWQQREYQIQVALEEEALAAQKNDQAENEEEADSEADEATEEEIPTIALEDIEIPAFTFENPFGENLYLQFGYSEDPGTSYLIYTCAYPDDPAVEGQILLLYEFPLSENWKLPIYDENGELIWNCVAYNIGEGWVGLMPEAEDVTEELTEGES